MLNLLRSVLRSALSLALPLCCFVPQLRAQAVTESPLRRQLDRLDLGVAGLGLYSGSSSGVVSLNAQPETITETTSNTLGALATLRYTYSPLLGAEFNYTFARVNQNYSDNAAVPSVQTKMSEFTLGYVAHGPQLTSFGIKPFAAVGLGTTAFLPTTFGGQLLREQARATYYYAIGAEAPVLFEGRVGLRAQFRQAFYKVPDFGQNYLTIQQHTSTLEPAIGIYLHF